MLGDLASRGDDAVGCGARVADSHHAVADLGGCAGVEWQDAEVVPAAYGQDGDVLVGVGAEQDGLVLGGVLDLDGDRVGVGDDVFVGGDEGGVALDREDEPGASGAGEPGAGRDPDDARRPQP